MKRSMNEPPYFIFHPGVIRATLHQLPEQTEPRTFPLLVPPEVLHANTAAAPSGPQESDPSLTLGRRFLTAPNATRPDLRTGFRLKMPELHSNEVTRSLPYSALNAQCCALFSQYLSLSISEAL